MPIFEINNLNVNYGAIKALDDVSFSVNEGEIVCLLGANGAGKTTIMKSIMGLLDIKQGEILFKSKSIRHLSGDKIVSQGISLSPEGRLVFADMAVIDNLNLGAYSARLSKKEKSQQFSFVFELFPLLAKRKKQLAGTLSGGEQQMLALARALMCKPVLLLLDEPSLGISPILTQMIFSVIQKLNKQGTSVLLAEQNARMALEISHRGYVLETGKIIHTATSKELLNDDIIRKSYLGV
jgi:branched-chain amino acid transport system ATP-binding protein